MVVMAQDVYDAFPEMAVAQFSRGYQEHSGCGSGLTVAGAVVLDKRQDSGIAPHTDQQQDRRQQAGSKESA